MADPVLVSAADGPMPPMGDAFKAIKAAGGSSVDVVLTDTDLVYDAELLELVELEIRDVAERTGLTVTISRRDGGSGGAAGGDAGSIYGPG